ncbi:hypothetical protein CRG98_017947 [Punica granatum]|uniref:Uncharacterized protein n=1 Tax=Punica granatum TaxID=22663 RepID=A0A2I0K0W9_PUNGR|nr:hypothetical protein CRG98_017947 [Punica granatum]
MKPMIQPISTIGSNIRLPRPAPGWRKGPTKRSTPSFPQSPTRRLLASEKHALPTRPIGNKNTNEFVNGNTKTSPPRESVPAQDMKGKSPFPATQSDRRSSRLLSVVWSTSSGGPCRLIAGLFNAESLQKPSVRLLHRGIWLTC